MQQSGDKGVFQRQLGRAGMGRVTAPHWAPPTHIPAPEKVGGGAAVGSPWLCPDRRTGILQLPGGGFFLHMHLNNF